jgi:diguanylate cyclase (GGDEF)-like protein
MKNFEQERPSSGLLDDRIYINRVRIFFGHATGNMANIFIGALLIASVLRSGGTSDQALAIWLGLLILPTIAVAIFERHVRNTGIAVDNANRFVRIRIGMGALVGFLYGVAVFLLPDSNTEHQDTFLFVIMSTLVTVAALGYTVMPPYYLTLALVSMVPMTLHFLQTFLQRGESYYLILVVVAVVWQAVVLKKALRVSTTSISAIRLNEQLQDEIEEHKRTKDAIRHLALHDALTGLANRRYFDESSDRALRVASRDASTLGFVTIDLDDFKPINDTYGHEVGDEVLRTVASRLCDCIRTSDFAARMGGDEFSVIIENVASESDVAEVVRKIGLALNQPVACSGVAVSVGASIGSALFPKDADQLSDLLRVADERMYAGKKARKQDRSLSDIS